MSERFDTHSFSKSPRSAVSVKVDSLCTSLLLGEMSHAQVSADAEEYSEFLLKHTNDAGEPSLGFRRKLAAEFRAEMNAVLSSNEPSNAMPIDERAQQMKERISTANGDKKSWSL